MLAQEHGAELGECLAAGVVERPEDRLSVADCEREDDHLVVIRALELLGRLQREPEPMYRLRLCSDLRAKTENLLDALIPQ